MADAHDELNALYQELRDELNRLAKNSSDSDDPLDPLDVDRLDQVDRRLMVRSAFAAIDALAYRLKQVALEPDVASDLTSAELALCLEDSYELTSNGETQTRPARTRFLPNLRFAFRIATKAEGIAFSLDVSGDGWQSVQKGVQVRDRLTHPKSLADLVVTEDEVRVSVAAFLWVEAQLVNWLTVSVRTLETKTRRLEMELNGLKRKVVDLERRIRPMGSDS